jgi:hypothetical protein
MKKARLEELKQKNEMKKSELKQRLREKLEVALNKRFQVIDEMNEDKQFQIYSRLKINIGKLEGRKTYT